VVFAQGVKGGLRWANRTLGHWAVYRMLEHHPERGEKAVLLAGCNTVQLAKNISRYPVEFGTRPLLAIDGLLVFENGKITVRETLGFSQNGKPIPGDEPGAVVLQLMSDPHAKQVRTDPWLPTAAQYQLLDTLGLRRLHLTTGPDNGAPQPAADESFLTALDQLAGPQLRALAGGDMSAPASVQAIRDRLATQLSAKLDDPALGYRDLLGEVGTDADTVLRELRTTGVWHSKLEHIVQVLVSDLLGVQVNLVGVRDVAGEGPQLHLVPVKGPRGETAYLPLTPMQHRYGADLIEVLSKELPPELRQSDLALDLESMPSRSVHFGSTEAR